MDPETGSKDDIVQCLTARMGGSMQRCEHWGLMEPPGVAFACKLSGASSSRVCTENLYQVTSQDISAATAGQLYGSSIHQPWGGGGGQHRQPPTALTNPCGL